MQNAFFMPLCASNTGARELILLQEGRFNRLMLMESRNNPIVKAARALDQAKARRETGTHRIEGDKLVRDAIASGVALEALFVEEGYAFTVPEDVRVYSVSRAVMESICDVRTPQHVAAVVRTPDTALPDVVPAGLLVLLDGVQDPGNVGTIIRSADAFGVQGVLLSQDCADPFAPKTLRAAMGSTYHLPLWICDPASALDRLQAQGYAAICGHLDGSETFPALQPKRVLIIGSEGGGVSDAVAARCTLYRLPMRGKAESLNAAVAAGVLLYLLSEQR